MLLPMLLLVIDTSGPQCAAGLYQSDTGQLLASRHEILGTGHAERLPGMLTEIFSETGLTLADLARVAVVVGPGSFTGIRVGVALARGLALALAIPVVGVTTLSVVAAAYRDGHAGAGVMAAIDARRGEIYCQVFDGAGMALTEPAALDHGSAVQIAKSHGVELAGSGAVLLAGGTPGKAEDLPLAVIARLGVAADPAIKARPLYIRGADAKPQTGFAVEHA
jgi:tRNA threonylcarbamoyl adenosine modification protein YeaZ